MINEDFEKALELDSTYVYAINTRGNIYEEEGKILTLKHGYPQFYTQILFEKDKQEIFIKAVLNDVESVSKVSTCKKIEKFDHQS